jgi:hypothetical protein
MIGDAAPKIVWSLRRRSSCTMLGECCTVDRPHCTEQARLTTMR